MKRFIYVAFFMFVSTLSVVAQDVPLWVESRTARFPDQQFVSALGIGVTKQASRNDALSQIALYFNSHVAVEQETQFRMAEGGEKWRAAEQNVSVTADVELPQLQFTAPFKNDKTGEWYICAYIDRTAAVSFCTARLERLLVAAKNAVETVSGGGSSLEDMRRLSAARAQLDEADALVDRLVALSRRGQDQYSARVLRLRNDCDTQFDKARRSATFKISVAGDGGMSVSTTIEEVLAAQGMRSAANGRYRISGRVTMELSENEVGVFARPGISLHVVDERSGETVYSFSRQYKKLGHKDVDGARAKAITEIEKDIRASFRPGGEM